MNNRFFIAALLMVALLAGCGYKEGVQTEAQKSFLYFSGDVEGVLVSVDGGAQFEVKPGRDNLYSIPPGKHKVSVTRGGTIVVERDIYVGDGVAKEIEVR
jgi:uncharacterized lipoprotein